MFLTWANLLYFLCGQIPICPSKAQVKANLPECFKTAYPDTCVILDCTEIKVRTPTSKVLNSEFYSSYNSHTTYKGLVGIAPNGTVTFISSLFQGSMLDKEITRQSGVVSLIEEGTEVMADKGFFFSRRPPVDRECETSNSSFLRKTKGLSDSGSKKFTASEVSNTQEIARLRMLVQKAIRRIKEYHFFDRVRPLILGGSVNRNWSVCCFLTRFKRPFFLGEQLSLERNLFSL